jgi:zinc/manganese transport system substrate-binding protein
MQKPFAKILSTTAIMMALISRCDAASLRVITTTTDLASLVTAVGGDKVEVEALVPGGFNADLYQPRPSDLFKVHRAKLFMQIGLGLEEWSRDLVNEANNSDLVKAQVSVGIPLMDVPKERVDYSFGDIHPYGNPHYQLDPEAGRIMAQNVFNALSYTDPADKDYFADKLKTFDEQLTTAEKKWGAEMEPFAGSAIIPYHESWSYFARAFKLTIPATIENKPGFAPSPSRVQEVIEIAKKEKVRAIVTEPYYDISIAQLIGSEAGVPCLNLTIDVGGTPEQTDYISMIDYVVNQFVEAFGGHAK